MNTTCEVQHDGQHPPSTYVLIIRMIGPLYLTRFWPPVHLSDSALLESFFKVWPHFLWGYLMALHAVVILEIVLAAVCRVELKGMGLTRIYCTYGINICRTQAEVCKYKQGGFKLENLW